MSKYITRGWWENSTVTVAHNTNDRLARLQYGGVLNAAFGTTATRRFESGKDETGLGRWVWMKFRGRNGMVLRTITAYRPVKSDGPQTVHTQHLKYFCENNIPGDQREIFMLQLGLLIDRCHTNGEQVILCGD